MKAFLTVTALCLLILRSWPSLVGLVCLLLIEFRAARLRLRVDGAGVTVANLLGTRHLAWGDIYGVVAPEQGRFELHTVEIVRRRGPLHLLPVPVDATLALGKSRRREIANRLAEIGGNYGYGFGAGTEDQIDAVREAGLLDSRDPDAHREWRHAHQG